MKKVAIIQPNYIPWKGYFDIINYVDEFILLDDVQYTKRDWRNRNIVKTNMGSGWLTIPVRTKDKFLQLIKDVEIDGNSWKQQHYETLVHNYKNTEGFQVFSETLRRLYQQDYTLLIDVLKSFLFEINSFLGIDTKISFSSDYNVEGLKTNKLIGLCKKAGATHYVSGGNAKAYLKEELFDQENIVVEWFNYSEPLKRMSVLDLIFNEGEKLKTTYH